MKNAKELMLEYTAFSFKDPKTAAEMFAEDGAFELPYLALPDHWIKFPDAPLLLPCYDLRPGDCFGNYILAARWQVIAYLGREQASVSSQSKSKILGTIFRSFAGCTESARSSFQGAR